LVTNQELSSLVKKTKETAAKRKFSQSFEILMTFKDLDLKKQPLNLNEVIFLPHIFEKKPTICILAGGDLALRARKAGVDRIIIADELDRLAGQKREIKKLASKYTFFLAETQLLPKLGKIMGQYLGPRGKMPLPIPPGSQIEPLIERYRNAVRIRSRSQMAAACKVGDQKMADEKIVENALAIVGALEKKLPSGDRNIRSVSLKLTMSSPAKLGVQV
jgi:large subunit ribosomal protein L1